MVLLAAKVEPTMSHLWDNHRPLMSYFSLVTAFEVGTIPRDFRPSRIIAIQFPTRIRVRF